MHFQRFSYREALISVDQQQGVENMNQDQLERRLRDLRNLAFTDNAPQDITAQIEAVKEQLKPYWDERVEMAKHARGQRLLQTWA